MKFSSKTPKFKPARFTSAEWLMIRYVSEEAVKHMQEKILELTDDFIENPGVESLRYSDVFEKNWRFEIEGEATDLKGRRRIIKFIFTFARGMLDRNLTYTRHISSGVQREFGIDKPIEIESFLSNEMTLRFLLRASEELTRSLVINISHEFNHFKNPWIMTAREQQIQNAVSRGRSSFREYVNAPSEFTSRLNQILVQMTLENEAGDNVLRRHWNTKTTKSEKIYYIYDLLSRNEEWAISGNLWTPENREKVIRSVMWFLDGGEIYHDRTDKPKKQKGEPGLPNVRLRNRPRKNINRKTIDMLPYDYPRRPGMRYVMEKGENRDMFDPKEVKKLTDI